MEGVGFVLEAETVTGHLVSGKLVAAEDGWYEADLSYEGGRQFGLARFRHSREPGIASLRCRGPLDAAWASEIRAERINVPGLAIAGATAAGSVSASAIMSKIGNPRSDTFNLGVACLTIFSALAIAVNTLHQKFHQKDVQPKNKADVLEEAPEQTRLLLSNKESPERLLLSSEEKLQKPGMPHESFKGDGQQQGTLAAFLMRPQVGILRPNLRRLHHPAELRISMQMLHPACQNKVIDEANLRLDSPIKLERKESEVIDEANLRLDSPTKLEQREWPGDEQQGEQSQLLEQQLRQKQQQQPLEQHLGHPQEHMQHHQMWQPSASSVQRSACSFQSAAGCERDLQPLKPKGVVQDISHGEVAERQFQVEGPKPDLIQWQTSLGQQGEKAAPVEQVINQQLPSEDWNTLKQAGDGMGDACQPGQLPLERNFEEIERGPCEGDACQPVQLPLEGNLEEIGRVPCEGSGQHARARFYSWEEMTTPTVWHRLGISPHAREKMLSPRTFRSVFGMQQEDFEKLPQWKRNTLKKQHGLF